jgi:hypothetical protein
MVYSYVAVAGFLPDPICSSVIEASEKLAIGHSSWYVLSKAQFPPHMTLWIGYIPNSNIGGFVAEVTLLVHDKPAISLQFESPIVEDGGYAAIPIVRSDALVGLHRLLLERLDRFRDGYIPDKYLTSLDKYPSDQRDSIKKYGTRFAGDLFKPHVSIGFVCNGDIKSATKLLPVNLLGRQCKVAEMTVFRQRETGRSIEVLGECTFAESS